MKQKFFSLKRSAALVLFLAILSGLIFSQERAGQGENRAQEPLTVAAVQYRVRLADYLSEESFSIKVEERVLSAVGDGAELIVFPEYINVFLAFSREAKNLAGARSIEEGLKRINNGEKSIYSLLLKRSASLRRQMDRLWGRLSSRHSVWILAGSYFAEEEDRLYNRAVLYGPDGRTEYEQDKVYLTPFEKEVLHLSPGRRRDGRTFEVDGWDCALTICRDTFFSGWEEEFREVELWIDIKANGEEYRRETEKLFEEALPERIAGTGVPYGLTACLNGRFLDLHWEGPSSVIASNPEHEGRDGGRRAWDYLERAERPDEPEILVEELRLPRYIED